MGVRHIRVEHLGTLVGGAERWSCGHQAFAEVGTNPVEDLALLAATAFAAQVFDNAPIKALFGSSVSYQGARVRVVSAAGVTEQAAENILTTPVVGTAGANLPPECAVVISLLTSGAGGRYRGRAFMPAPAASACTSDGHLDGDARDLLAGGWRDYLDQWNADPGALAAGVASNVGGFVTAIDRVRVGNVIDTQRRRRDALVESYAVEDLA